MLRFLARIIALLIFFSAFVFLSFAQNRPMDSAAFNSTDIAPEITIERYVHEVSLVLSVTDKKGHFVENLGPSDFSILDNDREQDALTFFQRQTDLPLRVALLIDISSSVADKFRLEQITIGDFLRSVARPSDEVAVFAFNQEVELVAPVTNNWKQVSRTVGKLKANGDTALYDAITNAAEWLANERERARRIMILITDGQENASKTNIDETISSVLAAQASIYAVNVSDDYPSDLAKQGTENLRQLADSTGGAYLRADSDFAVDRAFGKIRRELRSQYALAYRPSNLAEQAFHRLRVVAPNNLRVRCRTGYYAK